MKNEDVTLHYEGTTEGYILVLIFSVMGIQLHLNRKA
jgi:hypothetical protein